VLTSLPQDTVQKSNNVDKIYHIGAYGLLSIFLYLAILYQNKSRLIKKYPAIFTIIFAFFFGMLNEFHQLFIPTRSFNKFDLLANMVGIILTIILIKIAFAINKLYKRVI
jgi:VanZ family protein